MALTLGDLSGTISLDSSGFDKSLAGSQDKLADFGAKGKVVAAAAGVAIGAALAVGFAKSMDLEKGNDKLAAALGLNAAESEKAGKAAGKLYAGAYGESMEEVNGAVESVMSSIKGMREASSEDVQAMTAKVLDMAAAFEIDAGRAAQVAGQMITSGLAVDGAQAADLLTASLQKVPKAVREDILDAVDEYAPFMANLGIKGEEAMGLLVKASEKGMYGIDKTGDALKEFGIRATDMSEATGGAYEALGMDQADMSAKLLAGGDTAKTAFGDIIHGLQNMKDPVAQSQAALALFGTPLEDLSVTEIPNFLGALDPMGDKFDSVAGAADAMGKTLSDNAATKIESFKRTAQTAFIDVLGGQVLPVLENVAGFITATFGPALSGLYDLIVKGDYKGLLRDAFGWEEDSSAVGVILGVRDAALKVPAAFEDVIKKIWEFKEPIGIIAGLIITALIPYWVRLGYIALESAGKQRLAWAITQGAAFKAAYASMWAFAIMVAGWVVAGTQATIQAVKIAAAWLIAMGPVGWIIAGVAAIIAAFVLAYNNIGWFKDGVDAAMRWIGDVVAGAFAWIQSAIAAVIDWFTGTAVPAWDSAVRAVGGFFNWLWMDIIKPVFDGIGAVFTWLYESVVKPIFDGIGAVFNWLWETIIKPVFDGISAAVKTVGDVFNWLWITIIKPVFDSISVIVGGFYLFFRGIFQLVVSVIEHLVIPMIKMLWDRFVEGFNGIGAVFTWLYENVVKPVFDGIGAAIEWVWINVIKKTFDAWVSLFRDVIGPAFTWLYENVVKPIFDGIGDAITWVWGNVLKPMFDAWVSLFRDVLGPAFTWLYEHVIKPVFDAIGDAIKWVWDNVLKPTFDAWVYIFQNILGPAFKWLYENVIKPAFDGIGDAIKWVWDNVIKPVFDTLSEFITKTIPKAFEDGVGFIKKIWDGLIEIAKTPIRFVIEKVINEGLIGAFNTIAGVLPGIDTLPPVAVPGWLKAGAGFRDGGYTGNKPKGAVAGVVHGDEHVIRSESRRKFEASNPGALEHINRTGQLPSGVHAAGMPGPMPGEPSYFSSPKIDMMREMGRAFVRPLAGIDIPGAARAWDGVSRLAIRAGAGAPGINTGWSALPSNIYAWARMGGGEGSDIDFNTQGSFPGVSSGLKRAVAIHEIGHVLGLQHATSQKSIMHPNVSSSLVPTAFDARNLQNIYGAPGQPFVPGKSDGGGAFNPIAGIIDDLVKKFKDAFKDGGFIADLAIGIGKKLVDSASNWVGKKLGFGTEATAPTVYDGGGWLENTGGVQLVQHNKSKPDAVLSNEQWADIHKLAVGNAGNGVTYSPTYQYMGEDPETVARRDRARLMDVLNSLT